MSNLLHGCPETIDDFEEQIKHLQLCRSTIYNQAKAKIESGAAKSVSDASRQLAEETGRSANTIRQAIKREESSGTAYQLSELSGTDKHRPFASSDNSSCENKPHISNNSGNQNWHTPQYIIEAARTVMGSIDCDPASCLIANQNVKADIYFDSETNGLENKWNGNVWLNPPYSSGMMQLFSDALVKRFLSKEISSVCVLVNNATETGWFKKMADIATSFCFLSGRVKYLNSENIPNNAPLQGQVVLYFGYNSAKFKLVFSSLGMVLIHA